MQALKLGKFSFLSGKKDLLKKVGPKLRQFIAVLLKERGAQYDMLFYLVGFVAFPLMVQTVTLPR